MNSLTLLRRHRPACDAKHPVDSYTTEAEERRRNFKKCRCKIYAHGTLSGVFKKLATKARDWERAKEVVAPYWDAGSWKITPPELPPLPPAPTPLAVSAPEGPARAPEAKAGMPIKDAIQICLEEHKTLKSAESTIKKYRVVLGQFERFSAQLGLRHLEEWKPRYVRRLRQSWANQPLTIVRKLGLIKAFFEIFVEDQILEFNPARIRDRQNRALRVATFSQKNPFSDPELERMLEGCRQVGRELRRWPKKQGGRQVVAISEYRDYRRSFTGDDLVDFIQLSYFTGLRISDVAMFHLSRLTAAGEVKVRATKNGNWVSVWIPEWLRERIRARAARTQNEYVFGGSLAADLDALADRWRGRLDALWAKTGPWDEKPTHHRFRHTFIRILLERGVSPSLVAELVGDTEAMIRRHYSAWVPGRQENMSRILEQAFRNAPRFHHG